MKRFIGLFMAVLMIVSMIPMNVFAQEVSTQPTQSKVVFYNAADGSVATTLNGVETVYALVTFTLPQSGSASIIAASYNDEGKMLRTEFIRGAYGNPNESITYTTPNIAVADADVIKVFAFNTMETLVPLLFEAGVIENEVLPPTAKVEEIDVTKVEDVDLNFGLNFKADEVTEEQLEVYGDWYADFVLTVNKEVSLNADGTADGYLAGQYDAWNKAWVVVPSKPVTLKANEPYKIMESAAELMGKPGLKYTYREVYEVVKDFDCGIYFNTAFLQENKDVKATLELRMYNPVNEEEYLVIGDSFLYDATLPTAKVEEIDVTKVEDVDLNFGLNFKADEVTEEQLEVYGDWYADFVLTVNKEVSLNADGSADGYLAGQYDAWNKAWVVVPSKPVTLKANEPYKIMESAAELMGKPGLKYTYREVYEVVKDFDCGIYFNTAFLQENKDVKATLELRMYNPVNEEEYLVIGDSFLYDATLPTAKVEEIDVTKVEDVDLSFGLNFKADEVTEEQLEVYGEWYADFVLTVNKEVSLNADGTADGYLAGQYDAWNKAWVVVPSKPVTLKANEPYKIMESAAELMGKPGLKYTYREVYEVVKDFDCGIYFSDEFLRANPDVSATLEIRMFNPVNEEEYLVIGDTFVYTAPVVYVAQVNGEKYATIGEAVANANDGDIITVIADACDEAVKLDKSVTITGTKTLNNVSVTGSTGIEFTVSDLTFTGNSWINSGFASKLTVSGVTANVSPVNTTATNSRSAFIALGSSEHTPLELVVENSSIVTSGDRVNAILGWSPISKAVISGNTFGSQNAYYSNCDAVKFMGIAENAVFDITGNTVYSDYNGFVFAQNVTRGNAYTVNVDNNTFIGAADHIWVEVSGANTTHATIKATSRNTVNGKAFTALDIKTNVANWTSYAGVDVLTDEEGKLIGGTFTRDVTAFVADGYESVRNSDSSYSIAEKEISLKGSGTQEDPFLISNLAELKWFRDDVNECRQDGSSQYAGKYVKLVADIDLYEEDADGNQIPWEPIGSTTKDHGSFYGSFDGDGHTISNLYVNMTGEGAGFFAKTSGSGDGPQAVVKNITFNNVDVYTSGSYSGGVIANAGGNTVVENVHLTGDVYVVGYGYVGGIVGHGYPKMSGCSVETNAGSYINANYWCAGALVGYLGEGSKITDSSVNGNVDDGDNNLYVWGASGGAGAAVGIAIDYGTQVCTFENLSVKNVDVAGGNYYSGYVAGNGNTANMINVTAENVNLSSNIVPTDACATVGASIYFNLADAVKAAKDGDTVEILCDVKLAESIVLNTEGTVVIDGNGFAVKQAEGYKDTQNGLFMLGSTLYGDAEIENCNYTFKDVVFDGIEGYSAIRAQGVTLTLDGCEFVNGNYLSTDGISIVRVDYTETVVKSTTFAGNTAGMGIAHNWHGNSEASKLTVNECVFENNTFNNTAAVYYVKGNGCEITNNEFVDNDVNAAGNAATVYIGFQEGSVITGNLFKDNTVDTAHASSVRVAGAIMIGYEAVISGNAFDNNKATRNGVDAGLADDVCASTYYTGINLSGNYFDGEEPAEGEAYYMEYGTHPVTVENYYTEYSLDENGNVVLDGLTELKQLSGSGTQDDPFIIEDKADLLWFANSVNNEGARYAGQYVNIVNDINLEGSDWTPIYYLNGTILDGGNHTISNFVINEDDFYTWSSGSRAGGFIVYARCTVKNLTLSDFEISLEDGNAPVYYLTGLSYENKNGSLDNFHVKNVDITGSTSAKSQVFVGGVSGFDYGYSEDCSVTDINIELTVTEASTADVLVGGFSASVAIGGNTHKNCVVDGVTVDFTNNGKATAYVGGFAAQTQTGWNKPVIEDCHVRNLDITACGTAGVGGFIAEPGAHTIVTNCSAQGVIDATGLENSNGNTAGGFLANLGWNDDLGSLGGHVLTNCSADVDVVSNGAAAGGFVGSAINEDDMSMPAKFVNCTSSGDVTNNNGVAGGFAGVADRGTYTNCIVTGNVSATTYAGGFIGYAEKLDGKTIVVDRAAISGDVDGETFAGIVGYIEDGADVTLMDNTYEVYPPYNPAPELPEATVTEVDVTEIEDVELDFAVNFNAEEVTEDQLLYYGDWYADFVLTVNKDVTLNANGNADGYLAGQYDAWNKAWVVVPFSEVSLKAYEPLKIMETGADKLGKPGLKYTYREVYEVVKNFDCGIYFSKAFLNANKDVKATLEIRMYNPVNENEYIVIGDTFEYTPTFEPVARIGEETFTSLEDALAAAKKNDTVELLCDIDLANAKWTPVAISGITFDGAGYTISNLNVEGTSNTGLFSSVSGATVKNFTIENASVTGVANVGALAGTSTTSNFEGIHVTGDIKIAGNYMVGGLVGYSYGSYTDCSVVGNDGSYVLAIHDGNANEGDNIGGLIGHRSEGAGVIDSCRVENITVTGTRKIGGIAGTAFEDNIYTNNVVKNVTIATNATAEYAEDNFDSMALGGIVGLFAGDYKGGDVSNNTVENVTFDFGGLTNVSAGAVTGGFRIRGTGVVEPENVTYSDNVAADVVNANNTYLLYKESVKFESKLTNSSEYLYRVGNMNDVALGSLFKAADGVSIGNVSVEVADLSLARSTGVSAVYTPNTSDWTKSTLRFSGAGVVNLTITDDDNCTATTIVLEVVDAVNATTAVNATSNNVVLLNDVSGSVTISDGYAVYGNGYKIVNTGNGSYRSANITTGFVTISGGGILDNAQVICEVFPESYLYTSEMKADDSGRYPYALSAVVISDDSTISNCYIYGARNNVYINSGNVTIENTVLESGSLSNIHIHRNTDEYTVTLSDVTTIQYMTTSKFDTSKNVIGFGVVVGDDASVSNPAIRLVGDFKQYNWVTSEDASSASNIYAKSAIEAALSEAAYKHTIDGKNTVNMGIVYLNTHSAEIIDERDNKASIPYALGEINLRISGIPVTGQVLTVTSQSSVTEDNRYNAENDGVTPFVPSVNGLYKPQMRIDSNLGGQYVAPAQDADEYCYVDNGTLKVLFPAGEFKSLDLEKLLKLSKYSTSNLDLEISCVDEDGNAVAVNDGSILLTKAADYTVTYTVTDTSFFDKDGNSVENTAVYVLTLPLNVSVKDKSTPNARFEYVTANQKIYYSSSLGNNTQFIPFLAGLKIYDYVGETEYLRFDGDDTSFYNYIAKAAVTNNVASNAEGNHIITIEFVDGGILTVDLDARANSGSSNYTISLKVRNNILYAVNGGTTSAKGQTWKIYNYKFVGNNGAEIKSGVVTFGTSGVDASSATKPSSNFATTVSATVTFNANGGDCTQKVAYKTSLASTVTLATPSRAGYIFAGWYTQENGGTRVGGAGDSYNPSGDVTLYAQWGVPCMITYDANGGVCSVESEMYLGEALVLPEAKKDGFWFTGWYTQENGGIRVGGIGDTLVPDAKATLYAQWSEIYTVSFDADGGECAVSSLEYMGTALVLPAVSKTNMAFDGWYTQDGEKIGNIGDSYVPSSNVTLYAYWKAPVTVNYNANGGSSDTTSAIFYGDALVLPTASKSGYNLSGWYTSATGGTKVGNAGDKYVPETSVTLYAQWTGCVVTYDANSGTCSTASQTYAGSPLTLPTATRSSYSFLGWYTASSGGTKIGDAGASYTPTADITLYAHWQYNVCVTSDTLVTLSDGGTKRVDELTLEDELLVWNFFEGKYDAAPAAIIFYHGDAEYEVLNLEFSDGTAVKVIENHGFFDEKANEFVFIDKNNVESFIGTEFVKAVGGDYTTVTLTGFSIFNEYTGSYSVQTAKYINFMAGGMFSMTYPPFDGWFDYFELGEDMKYDEEKMQSDIEKYGLYTYDDFAEYVTYEQFVAFNGPYLKVLVGRGVVTLDEILALISAYVNVA